MQKNNKVELRVENESGVPHYYRVGDGFSLCGRRETAPGTASANLCPICNTIKTNFSLELAEQTVVL